MKKFKNILMIFLIVAIIAAIIIGINLYNNWPFRFKKELDKFFGKGNWECISEETKESTIYTEYIYVHSNPEYSEEVPGKYKNWYIKFNNKNQEEIWKITNHTLKINNDKYGLFSSKRYSSKQALIQELMDISCEVAAEEVYNEIIEGQFSENEAECIDVLITYKGGNPEPDFYDKLYKEEWFTVDKATAYNYLSCDLHDFYLYIRAHDYKLNKLTDEEKQNVLNSLENIEQKLLEKYGGNASFKIYLDNENKLEYIDGIKQ